MQFQMQWSLAREIGQKIPSNIKKKINDVLLLMIGAWKNYDFACPAQKPFQNSKDNSPRTIQWGVQYTHLAMKITEDVSRRLSELTAARKQGSNCLEWTTRHDTTTSLDLEASYVILRRAKNFLYHLGMQKRRVLTCFMRMGELLLCCATKCNNDCETIRDS